MGTATSTQGAPPPDLLPRVRQVAECASGSSSRSSAQSAAQKMSQGVSVHCVGKRVERLGQHARLIATPAGDRSRTECEQWRKSALAVPFTRPCTRSDVDKQYMHASN